MSADPKTHFTKTQLLCFFQLILIFRFSALNTTVENGGKNLSCKTGTAFSTSVHNPVCIICTPDENPQSY